MSIPSWRVIAAQAVCIASLGLAGCGGKGTDKPHPATHSVSGTVSGATADGVAVSLSGDATGVTTTAGGGHFAFTGLADGSYTLIPSKQGFTFAPQSLQVTVAGADVAGRDFTATPVPPATHSVSGTVSGATADGVAVTLSGDASGAATTAGGGHFTFTGLTDGNYTLTPSKQGFTFSPPSLQVTVAGADVAGRDFTATTAAPGVFHDGFETGWGDWGASNGVWEVGTPTSGPNGCHTGSSCAATILAGNYPNTDSRLVSPTIALPSLAAGQELQLRFWHWFSFACGYSTLDRGTVYVETQTSPGVWSTPAELASYVSSSGGVWTRPPPSI